jgi:hypothetical protein
MATKKQINLEKLTLKEIFHTLLGDKKAKKVLGEIHSEIKKGRKGEALRSSIFHILARNKVTNAKMSSILSRSIASTMSDPTGT